MLIWYRNSILASIISLIGCAGVVAGISELFKDPAMREMSVPETIGFIAAGILFAILGKVISANKEKKKQAAGTQAASQKAQTSSGAHTSAPVAAQPAPARSVQQAPVPTTAPALEKPAGKSLTFAKICYLLATVFAMWGFYLYNQFRRSYGSKAEFGTIGFDRLGVLLFLAGVACLLLMFACSATKRKQAASALYVPGFLGLIAIQAEDALRCYRAYGFGGYIAGDGTSYYAMISVPLLRIAALLLMLLFACCAMKNARERNGGVVRWLWFVPFVMMALAFAKAFTDSYLYDLVVSTLFRKGVRLRMRPEYMDMLSQLFLVLGVLFNGFCFRNLCRKSAAVNQQPVYEQPQYTAQSAPVYEQPQYTAPVQSTPVYEQPQYTVQSAPAYEQPQYTAPVQPEPRQAEARPAAKAAPQNAEKQLRAYRDLLEAGILTQAEYDQKVSQLTH